MPKSKRRKKAKKPEVSKKFLDIDKSTLEILGFCSIGIAIMSGILAMPLEPFNLFIQRLLLYFVVAWVIGLIGFLIVFFQWKERENSDKRKKKDK